MIIFFAHIEEEKHQYLLNKYSRIYPKKFKVKLLKYNRWQDAQLSLLGRILLQYGLGNYFGIRDFEISQTSYSKPFLKNHEIHFNISHAGNLVVCGISKFPIGIDIEYVDDKIKLLTLSILNDCK
ncbi:4'-phosphopantetheinyl transferase family protein [Chryseobacterium cucumeris]